MENANETGSHPSYLGTLESSSLINTERHVMVIVCVIDGRFRVFKALYRGIKATVINTGCSIVVGWEHL